MTLYFLAFAFCITDNDYTYSEQNIKSINRYCPCCLAERKVWIDLNTIEYNLDRQYNSKNDCKYFHHVISVHVFTFPPSFYFFILTRRKPDIKINTRFSSCKNYFERAINQNVKIQIANDKSNPKSKFQKFDILAFDIDLTLEICHLSFATSITFQNPTGEPKVSFKRNQP